MGRCKEVSICARGGADNERGEVSNVTEECRKGNAQLKRKREGSEMHVIWKENAESIQRRVMTTISYNEAQPLVEGSHRDIGRLLKMARVPSLVRHHKL